MKAEFVTILKELEKEIHLQEMEFVEVLRDAPKLICVLELGFEKIKSLVSDYVFEDKIEEINFFKDTKPKLFSKLIYYQKIYHIELKRPISGYVSQKKYLEKELEQISVFFNKNADFIQYYRSGKTILDECYFLRGNREIDLNLESFYFERDPKFSTSFDFKVSKLLANDLLAAYLSLELNKLKLQENTAEPIYVSSQEKWTDKKTALVEIIYAIHATESVSNGNISHKLLAAIFSKAFNVDLSDLYSIFLEIRRRENRTEYLHRMIKALEKRMDDLDEK